MENQGIWYQLKHISMKSNKLVIPVISGTGINELDPTTHPTVPDNQYQAIQQEFPTSRRS